MTFAFGLAVLSMSMPIAQAPFALRIEYLSNNGSVPPPYHRATEIRIDADGQGTLLRRHGYDRQDASSRIEIAFAVDVKQLRDFASRLQDLGVYTRRWKEQARPPVGGSVVHVTLNLNGRDTVIPAFPINSQRELAENVRQQVFALLPEAAITARTQWEQAKGAPE